MNKKIFINLFIKKIENNKIKITEHLNKSKSRKTERSKVK